MKGYKAFEKGLVCKGKQYAENTVFEEENAEVCQTGMHFCKNPIDVLKYYPLVNENGERTEFAEVEALDDCKTDDGKKYCTKKLKIGKKLSFDKFVEACVNFDKEMNIDTKFKTPIKDSNNLIVGSYAQSIFSRDFTNMSVVGEYSIISLSGSYNKICSIGDSNQLCSSGTKNQIGSSGIGAKISSSGDCTRIMSMGEHTKISSSGWHTTVCSIDTCAKISSSGDSAKINSTGKYSVICCAGNNSCVKGKIGSWITLSEWKYSEEEKVHIPVCVKTEKIDGKRIKEDTYYRLHNGEFVEVEE